jgi:GntR family transcriptional regulator/MocR family aminotransferase
VTLPWRGASSCCSQAEAQRLRVIEDDYEAENLHEGTPMPALKSLDKSAA